MSPPVRVASPLLLVLALACASCAGPGSLDVPPQSLTLLVGPRSLDPDFAPADDQGAVGLMFELHQPEGLQGFEVGVMSGRENEGPETFVEELFFGAHLTGFANERIGAWAGSGIDFLRVRGDRGSDGTTGWYVQGGVRTFLSELCSLGLAGRAVVHDALELDFGRADPSYAQAMLTLTWHF